MEKILGIQLIRISTMIRRELDNQADGKMLHKATGGNGWIMKYLARNEDHDVYQKDIEEHFSVTRSTVSKVVKLMEEKGLIQRLPVPGDARLKKAGTYRAGAGGAPDGRREHGSHGGPACQGIFRRRAGAAV